MRLARSCMTANPSIFGIIRSSTMRSGGCARYSVATSSGSVVVTTFAYPACCSSRSSRRTFGSWSSTTRMRASVGSCASADMVEPPFSQDLVEDAEELLDVDRLGQVRGGARREQLLDPVGHRVGADHDHRDVDRPG